MTTPTPNTAVATRAAATSVKVFQDALTTSAMQKRIASVLPKHMTPERVIKIAVSAISRNPLLLQCSVESVMKGVIIASELGLELNGALGHAYLVPYFNNKTKKHDAQFIPGYKGLVELARRSGYVVGVEARTVYENDFFEFEYGLHPKLIHKPTTGDPGKLKYVYAINRYKNEYSDFVVLTLSEVNRHRERSKAKDSGPWVTDYEAMALKTAVRVLEKLAPQSPEIAQAIAVEDRFERGEQGLGDLGFQSALDDIENGGVAEEVKTRTDELKDVLSNNGDGLNDQQGEMLAEILEIAEALSHGDARKRAARLRSWTDDAVGMPGDLAKRPDLFDTALDRARAERDEAAQAAVEKQTTLTQ